MDFTEEDYELWLRSSGLMNQLDPMTPTQMEASRRMVADRTFQNDVLTAPLEQPEMPPQPTYPFPGTELDPISEVDRETGARMVSNAAINQSPTGSVAQGMAMAGPVGGAVSGGLRAAGAMVPRLTERVAQMPGVSGMLARQVGGRVPTAGGNIAAVETMKHVGMPGRAMAQDTLPPPPQFNPGDQDSVAQLQTFLAQQGENVGKIDGVFGGGTNAALSSYLQRRNQQIEAQNTPEMRELRNLERRAGASKQLEEVEAARAAREGKERQRRGNVLAEAEKRYANRAQSTGQEVTQFLQDNIGNAIMLGAAALGGRGIAKIPSQRKFAGEVNALATRNANRRNALSNAQMRGFNKAYDQAKPKNSLAEMTGVYGALGAEMYLAEQYLDSARKEYNAAIDAFEKGAKAGGGKERELADRVAKAKAEVKKWERLQGAGLHGMGYYTAGKMMSGAASAAGARPSAQATQQRETYRQLLKPRRSRSAQSQSGQAQILVPQTPSGGPPGGSGQGPSNPLGTRSAQGQDSSTRPRAGLAGSGSFRKTSKESIAVEFAKNGGKLSQKQAEALAPGVSPEKVKDFLRKIRQFARDGMAPNRIVAAVKRGDIRSLAVGTVGGAAAYNMLGEDFE